MIVVISDTATCIFGGFVIFSFLGYMAGQLGLEVKDVVKDGRLKLALTLFCEVYGRSVIL